MQRKKTVITPQGLDKLKKEYEDLQEKRSQAVKELTTARDMGDRSENAAYKSARFKLSGIDRRLRTLKLMIKNSSVVVAPTDGSIGIGTTVTLEVDGAEKVFTIVGSYEADIMRGEISNMSPLGKNLIGKKVTDIILLQTPKGILKYKILQIK